MYILHVLGTLNYGDCTCPSPARKVVSGSRNVDELRSFVVCKGSHVARTGPFSQGLRRARGCNFIMTRVVTGR